ncbi:MAG: hypothetical protein ACK4GN_00630 [Runella sp.]
MKQPLSKNFLLALILLPTVIFYGFGVAYSLNIPWFDDIENLPYFLNRLLDAQNGYEHAEAFLRPNNEHRVLSARLIAWATYTLTGEMNFRLLNFIGNLSVLAIFFIVARAYLKNKGALAVLVLAAFLIFHLQYYSMTFMAIMSLQYQLIIAEVFLALYLMLKPQRWAFALAVMVAVLGTFSMGNGMMVWPTGVLVLGYLGHWRRLAIWLTLGVGAIVGYFWGYAFVQGNDEGFRYFLQHPLQIIGGFFVFVGGVLDWFPRISFQKRQLLPLVGGVFIVSFFVYYVLGALSISGRWRILLPLSLKKYYSKIGYFQSLRPNVAAFWIGCFIYLFINSALVVFFRTRFDYQLVLWATYKIYPATLMAICVLLTIQILENKWQKIACTVFGLVAFFSWASSYWYFVPQVQQDRQQRMALAYNQKYNSVGLGAEKGSAFAQFIVGTLDSASRKGFYNLPNPLIHPDEASLLQRVNDATQRLTKVKVNVASLPHALIVSQDTISFQKSKREGCFVILHDTTRCYVFGGDDLAPFRSVQSGFRGQCPVGIIEKGTYQVKLWVVQKTDTQLLATDQTVRVEF